MLQICRYRSSDGVHLMIDMEHILLNLRTEQLALELGNAYRYCTACKIIAFDNTEAILTASGPVLQRFEAFIALIPLELKIIFLYRAAHFAINGNLFDIPQHHIELLNY